MSKLNIKEEKQENSFQIVMVERDKNGKPTGKKISYSSNEANEICDFHNKNKVTPKRSKNSKNKKNKKNKKGKAN